MSISAIGRGQLAFRKEKKILTKGERPKAKGFTLIELVIGIAVLAIITAIGTNVFVTQQARGSDVKRKSDFQKLKIALENYHSDYGVYPPNIPLPAGCTYKSDGAVSGASCPSASQTYWIPGLSPDYLKTPPKDPKQTRFGGVFLAIGDFFGKFIKLQAVHADTQGPRNAAALQNVTNGFPAAWSSALNAQTSNNAYATASLPVNSASQWLRATGFGFTIPSTAIINGIEARIERKASVANEALDATIRLVKNSSPVGTNVAASASIPTSDTIRIGGAPTYLWGTTWTPAEINNSGFGVIYGVQSRNPVTVSVDHINITVYYIVPTPTPAPTVSISASPTPVFIGQSTTITWSSTTSTSCTASGAWSGSKATSGSESQTPGSTGTHTYTLTCSGPGGSGTNSTTVTVNPYPVPTVSISASPTTITLGESTSLAWWTQDATSCSASSNPGGVWTGQKSVGGSAANPHRETVTPNKKGIHTFTLNCSGPGGSTQRSAIVTVNPAFEEFADSDQDGFSDGAEALYLGTDRLKKCSDTIPRNERGSVLQPPPGSAVPGEPVSPWPPDFDDNQVVDSLDRGVFISHYPAPDRNSPKYDPRFDLGGGPNSLPDGAINALDFAILNRFFRANCPNWTPFPTPTAPPTAAPPRPPAAAPGAEPSTGDFELSFTYYYEVSDNHQRYVLWTSLETFSDPQLYFKSGATCRQTPPSSENGKFAYNYCVVPQI